jgi:hypothetical protein
MTPNEASQTARQLRMLRDDMISIIANAPAGHDAAGKRYATVSAMAEKAIRRIAGPAVGDACRDALVKSYNAQGGWDAAALKDYLDRFIVDLLAQPQNFGEVLSSTTPSASPNA